MNDWSARDIQAWEYAAGLREMQSCVAFPEELRPH